MSSYSISTCFCGGDFKIIARDWHGCTNKKDKYICKQCCDCGFIFESGKNSHLGWECWIPEETLVESPYKDV